MPITMNKSTAILLSVGAIGGLILGLIIGAYTGADEYIEDESMIRLRLDQWVQDGGDGALSHDGRTPADIMAMVNTDNIAANVKELSLKPHLAGSERDEQLARLLHRRFQDAGFDSVEMPSMDFLLSRPDPDNPNLIRIYDSNNDTTFTSNYREQPIHADDADDNFVDAFNAYTPKGDVWSRLGEGVVYVNYGRIEDFEELEKLGASVTGKIVLMRYGKIFRGNKVQHAAKFGGIGAILFSDPEDVARLGQAPEDVYPYTTWLPGTGMQRGNAFIGDGDPLTPGWPSTDDAYRIRKEDAGLPTIPTQPIGYADAREILSKLGGQRAPDEWQGKIVGVIYNIGPSFRPEFSGYRLRLTSNNAEMVVKSYNVIGTIIGSLEPDRYVFIGNHRDAWGYGASDPSSGTAQLLETARVLGEMIKNGWRPRRTLVFCSWGSEEYGLIGSTEWVEQHVDKLQGRTVAYINTDTCASGPHIQLKSSPLLWDLLKKMAGLVPGVIDSSMTLLDEWIANDRMADSDAREYPIIKTLGSGSDYAAFSFYAGIPAMDVWFRKDQSSHKGIYASYHTGYETYFMISNNTDPGFKIIQGCSRLAALTLKYLTDSLVIPFSLAHFPRAMKKSLDGFAKDGKRDTLRKIYNKYDSLEDAVRELIDATEKYHIEIEEKKFRQPLSARTINDQLMKFEQVFTFPAGLPGRPLTRHAVFAPSQFDNYASAGFPGIADLLYGYDKLTSDDMAARQEQIRRHISDLTIMTQRATGLLGNLHEF